MWQKISFRNIFIATLILNLITILLPLILKSFLPPVVPLFYGRPYGNQQLVPEIALMIAPGASLIITIVNLFLNIYIKGEFIKKVLSISALFVSILTTISVVKIILLVGFF